MIGKGVSCRIGVSGNTICGELDAAKAAPSEARGQVLFNGKARCAACHPAPNHTDHDIRDLKAERLEPRWTA